MSNSPWDKGFVSGAKAERERIIKLLEDSHEENTWQHYPDKWVYMEDCAVCSVLPLIKGSE